MSTVTVTLTEVMSKHLVLVRSFVFPSLAVAFGLFVTAVFDRYSDGRTVRGSIAGRGSAYLMSCPDRLLGPLSLMLNEYQAVYPQNKGSRHVKLTADLAIAESEDQWSCTSSPHMCLRDTFTGNILHCSLLK